MHLIHHRFLPSPFPCSLGIDSLFHSIAHVYELFIKSKDPPPHFILAVCIPVLVERGQPRFVRRVPEPNVPQNSVQYPQQEAPKDKGNKCYGDSIEFVSVDSVDDD